MISTQAGITRSGAGPGGYRYDCAKLWIRVRKAAMASGNPYIELKETRHSFACNCLQLGHPVERVACWLGHKDPRMVRQRYAFLLDYDDDTGLQYLGVDTLSADGVTHPESVEAG